MLYARCGVVIGIRLASARMRRILPRLDISRVWRQPPLLLDIHSPFR